MGRGGGGGGRVLLLALVLSLTLQTPASASQKCYLLILNDLASVSTLLAPLTSNYRILYLFSEIKGIGLQIDEGFVPTLVGLPGVLAVIPDSLRKPYTTHSWEYLKLEKDGKATYEWESAGKFGEGIIIGNVDTGVWPESDSFRNDGLGIPSGWRGGTGGCDAGDDKSFSCNKKLIGARFFNKGIKKMGSPLEGGQQPDQADLSSPRDYVGHGSHTLSTAGGGFVPGASAFGHGNGTAKGGSPRARVASYKACYAPGCSSMDILAAIVAAVKDGVQVLSLSVGSDATDYLGDMLALGAFHAVMMGVTVVCAGGNSGPQPGSITNVAPWILTVGAGTMDRDFPANVTFGFGDNTMTIKGQSMSNSTQPVGQQHPMISGTNANLANQSTDKSTLCLDGSLDPAKVSGKIVVCTRGVNGRAEKGRVVKEAGGVGMVLCNDAADAASGDIVIADPHIIPAAHCSYSECIELVKYLQSTASPVGNIATTEARLGVKPAPVVAGFSSRGPNPITPQILKPDIIAPGVSVIAAYSENVSPTGLPFDDRRVPYNIESGTSMACPHVAGVAGLLKAKYPNWTPAMIKSAIMTTATTGDNDGGQIQDETGSAATPFSCGSGQVNPVRALDPGLVYDTKPLDYANFLCSLRLTRSQDLLPISIPPRLLPLFLDANVNPFDCSKLAYGRPEDLNYPSISAACLSGSRDSRPTVVERRVRNVGGAPSTYNVTVTQPAAGVKVTVEPTTLTFGTNEEKKFTVKLQVYDDAAASKYVFGSIEWSDSYGKHRVRSPIVATTKCG